MGASLDREKSSFECFLEHFKSSNNKIMMEGPIVCQLSMGWNQQTKILEIQISLFYVFFCALGIHTNLEK